MKDFDKNILNLHNCLGNNDHGWLEKRMVYEGGAPRETTAESVPTSPESAPLVEINTFKAAADYQENRNATLEELAQKDQVLKTNFEKAIEESLTKAGYDNDIDTFWNELKATYGCNKVKVENGKIHFFKDSIEVTPHFSVIPITPDLSRFHTDTPRSKYYTPETGLVSLKNWKETRTITVNEIVLNSRPGTQILVTAPRGKTRQATFDETGEKAFYTDGKKEIVKIFDGYKVELVRAEPAEPSEKPRVANESLWGKYPVIGEFMFGKINGSDEQYSANEYISWALTGQPAIPNQNENAPNLIRLRELYNKQGYDALTYQKFLKEKGAIKTDRVMLLVDTDFATKKNAEEQETKENITARTRSAERTATQSAERAKYLLPKNLLELRKFQINDPRLIEAIDNPKKWADAWAAENIEGIRQLKAIVASEPDIFGAYSKTPDALRERLRDAISVGTDKQIDFEDLIDNVLQARMPSFSVKADSKEVAETQKTQGNFSEWYKKMSPEQKKLDQIAKTYGLLKKLGKETLNTATVIKSETDAVWLNIQFDGYAYTIKVNEGGAVVGEETVKFYQFGTRTPNPQGNGYESGLRFTVGTLTEGGFEDGNDVQKEVRDILTPSMTYDRFVKLFKANFNANGTPKRRMPPEFQERMQNIIIGGNRFLLQLSAMSITEGTKGEVGRNSFIENRTAVLPDTYVAIINNEKQWQQEWTNPQHEQTKRLKSLFKEDPVLADIAPGKVGPRLHNAVNRGDESQLTFSDVIEEVLKGQILPKHGLKPDENPVVDDYDDFMEYYNRVCDAQGNPKPGVPPAVAERYNNIIRAANKVLVALEGGRENIRERSEDTYYSQKLRQAGLPSGRMETTGVYNADDVINGSKTNQVLSLHPSNQLSKGVGLQMADNLLGNNQKELVRKNKLYLFQAIFRSYSLDQLIAEGCIIKAESKKLPNQEFYVITKLPAGLDQYIKHFGLAEVAKYKTDFNRPLLREAVNPQARLERYTNAFFPLKNSERTNADVGEAVGKGREEDRLYNRLDYTFAHTQFMKDVTNEGTVNGTIVESKLFFQLNRYLELFNARLDLEYGEAAKEIRAKFEKVCGKTLSLGPNNIEAFLKNPEASKELSRAIRDGFLFAHDEKIDKQREDAIRILNEQKEEWIKKLTPEDRATLEKSLREAGVPPEEIPAAVEKILPIWFALGVDTVTGNVGVGVAVGLPIKLGHNGEYGMLIPGVGAGVGVNYKDPGVGAHVGAGIAYKTPNLGPFSVIGGVGGHLGVYSGKEGVEGGAGIGAGVGLAIELGTIGNKKITVTPGVTYPFLLGCVLSWEPDHEVTIKDAQQASREAFKFDKTDAELENATTDQQKIAAIQKNTWANFAILKANRVQSLTQLSADRVVREYKKYKANLAQTIRENYDPGNRWSIGLGVDPYTGKFIIGFGTSIITSKEVKSVAYEGKGADVMQQEMTINQMRSLADRKNHGETLTPRERSEIQTLTRSGKLLTVAGSNDLAIFMPQQNIEAPKPSTAPIENVKDLENRFNEILKPLHLQLAYDEQAKLFEIRFTDWNQHTNYDIAVDSKMTSGGIISMNHKIYLASNFDINNPPTILRADYEYPFAEAGKNYHTIVTISDSPQTPSHEIYSSAPQILSSRGGEWYQQRGNGYERYAGKQRNNIMGAESLSKYTFDTARLQPKDGKTATDSAETQGYIDQLNITEAEKGTLDEAGEKAVGEFAKKFLQRHPLDYRKRSNKETLNNQFGDLNDMIIADWKKEHDNAEPTPAELNEIRLKIMDESFSELGRITNPKAREAAFQSRLEWTINNIIKPRFALLIERNHQKYKENDPRYIRNTVDDLSRVILARVKSIKVNQENGIPLSQIDRTSTVAGTLNIFGFRGNTYGADNSDKNQAMIGASANYASFLKNKPDGYDADIARLIFEETSTLPETLDISPDTAIGQIDKTKAYDLLRADLSQKIISNLFSPLSRDLFSEGVRAEILRLAANKTNLEFNGISARALYELQNLVEGIRLAEMKGDTYYIPKNNPDYRFSLDYKVQDGVYKKCTNYSMWVNEGLTLEMRTSRIPVPMEIRAGYGVSTGTTVLSSTLEFTSINIAAAVAAKLPSPKATPPAAPQKTDGSGGNKVDQEGGGEQGGDVNKPAAPQAEGGGPAGPETAPPGSEPNKPAFRPQLRPNFRHTRERVGLSDTNSDTDVNDQPI